MPECPALEQGTQEQKREVERLAREIMGFATGADIGDRWEAFTTAPTDGHGNPQHAVGRPEQYRADLFDIVRADFETRHDLGRGNKLGDVT